MNVNLGEGGFKSEEIRRELKERKQIIQNAACIEVKPFKSFRSSRECESIVGKKEDDLERRRQGDGFAKLKREYPSPVVCESNKEQNISRQGKYKYQIEVPIAVQDENKVPSYITQSAKPKTDNGSDKIRQKSDLIKENFKGFTGHLGNDNYTRRKEVESIIFDSKVSAMQGLSGCYVKQLSVSKQYQEDKNLLIFQEKVNKVNDEIEAGLSHLQRMIEDVRRKKAAKSQIQNQLKMAKRLQDLEQQFAQRRADFKEQRLAQEAVLGVEQQVLFNKIEVKASEFQKQVPIKNQNVVQQQFHSGNSDIADSHIQLQGDVDSKKREFPPEYTSFINRLSNQIEKDVEFTNKIMELTKSRHIEAVKAMILQQISRQKAEYLRVDESFFQIQQSEIDPLDQGKPGWFKKYSQEELKVEALKVFKMYRQIESHFETKLSKKIENSMIELLFDQLAHFSVGSHGPNSESCATVGHLLSYLNMRTNKGFRNRSFVKMLKRLCLKGSVMLSVNSFAGLTREC